MGYTKVIIVNNQTTREFLSFFKKEANCVLVLNDSVLSISDEFDVVDIKKGDSLFAKLFTNKFAYLDELVPGEFMLFLPHTNKLEYQYLGTSSNCISVTILEEGIAMYRKELWLTKPWIKSVNLSLYPLNMLFRRIVIGNYFFYHPRNKVRVSTLWTFDKNFSLPCSNAKVSIEYKYKEN